MRELTKNAVAARKLRKAQGLSGVKTPLERLTETPKSKARAIEAMCYTCQGGSESTGPDAGWKWAIGNCQVLTCPLHAFRPYRKKCGEKPEGVYRWQDS